LTVRWRRRIVCRPLDSPEAEGPPMSAAVAAAAAEEAARRQREEEEEMTPYGDDDLRDAWEFKILRSTSNDFAKPDVLRAALEEEARSGWVMVEKFDDQRLRLKRRADARTSEYGSDVDPYRTYYGRTPTQQGMRVLAWVLAATLAVAVIVALVARLGRG
jgi:hypothetical protein